jgi:hypothetical protein
MTTNGRLSSGNLLDESMDWVNDFSLPDMSSFMHHFDGPINLISDKQNFLIKGF